MSKKLSNLAALLCVAFLLAISSFVSLYPQPDGGKPSSSFFSQAKISLDKRQRSPVEIRFQEGKGVPAAAFFEEYKKAFGLSDDNELKPLDVFADQLGQTHHRLKQHYQGIELADTQFLLHEKNGLVSYAHGNLIHGVDLEVRPALSEAEALRLALAYVGAESYLWENLKNEIFVKKEQADPQATFYPKGELKISAGRKEMLKENFRLVYRFDIYAAKPLGRYYVDVDAKTGEVINAISRIQQGDVAGQGLSLYNGTVPITVSDANFPIPAIIPSRWHPDTRNALGGSGESWWAADPSLGNAGGYANVWYEVLDTDPITLNGANPRLTFSHRYAVEAPGGEPAGYNGWDGMNVRISNDGGITWQVLANPTPAYTKTSLYSFGFIHGEGTGIPGWADRLNNWTQVTISLSAFAGQTVRLRFAFASDGGLSTADGAPELFGWQIDDLVVSSSAGTLYNNNGVASGMTASNLVKEVTVIAGNYRLREAGRGKGIFTYDMKNGVAYALSVDFVDDNDNFTDTNARAGVSAHWAAEATYDYYLSKHGRNSFDNAAGRIISYVHYQNNFNNAFWDGARVTFGDGNGNNEPLVTLDIVGHELTHGVTEFSANLIYVNESGALNESFSDILGEAIESFVKKIDPDWLEGADIGAIRSLKDPNSFGDPDTYLGRFWVPSTDTPSSSNDQGGVHSNSGVQNHWFYLLSEGGSGVNDNGDAYNVTGIGVEQAAQIAYRNLTAYLMPSSGYYDARLASLNSAIDLFGENSPQLESVKDAWFAVGVTRPTLEPTVAVSSEALSFVAEVAAETDTMKLTIANFGLNTLTINEIQVSGAPFQVLSSVAFPQQLNYEDEITVAVVFAPVAEGESIGTLSVLSNDPINPVKSVRLQARGFIIHPTTAGLIYAAGRGAAGGTLLTLNANTGAGAMIGPTGLGELTGVTIRPSSGVLHATLAEESSTLLIRIDAESGFSDSVSVISVPNMKAIAFDATDNLYGVALNDGKLYSLNPSTGGITLIGATGLSSLIGLAINPVDNMLWGMRSNGAIYKINQSTAVPTLVGNSGFSLNFAMAFDADGKLFGISSAAVAAMSDFIRINTSTGAGTLVGSTGFRNVFGLAIRGAVVTGVQDPVSELLPTRYELHQNYPNPFNPTTVIRYDLPEASEVVLKIYDVMGREVRTLVNARQSAGYQSAAWDGRNEQGQVVGSGVYVYQLQAGDRAQRMKMLFLK